MAANICKDDYVDGPISGRGVVPRVIGWLVFRIDDVLRARHRVVEFSDDPRTIFRLQLRACTHEFELSDATSVSVGDRMIDLHLWNEHLPRVEDGSLQFARRMNERLQASLRDLAAYVSNSPDLSDVRVVRANMGFGTSDQSHQLVRISSLYGFEPIADPRFETFGQRLHRFGENVLISLMVYARNGRALRRDTLKRSRVQIFLSRRSLLARYGRGQLPRSKADA